MTRLPLLIPIALLVGLLSQDRDATVERRMVETLRERGGLIRDRLKVAYSPFLRECEVHLAGGDLSKGARGEIEGIALQTLAAWAREETGGGIPAVVRRQASLFPVIRPGEERAATVVTIARRVDREGLSEDDRSTLIEILRQVPGTEAEMEVRRLEGTADAEVAPTAAPPEMPSPEALAGNGEWRAAYLAHAALPDPDGRWPALRERIAEIDGMAPLRIRLGVDDDHPALDAYAERWPRRVHTVGPDQRPQVQDGPETIPFPGQAPGGAWEILLPRDRGWEVDIPLPDGRPSRLIAAAAEGRSPIRVPRRIPDGMAFVPAGEGVDVAFFIDRAECTGGRIAEFLEGRPEELDWLARQVSSALEISPPEIPARLRRGRPSVEAWRAVTNFAAFWERKSIPRAEEWVLVTRRWADAGGLRRSNLGKESPAIQPGDLSDAEGPGGILHLLGNVWEVVEGRRIVGGGAEPLPWHIARDPVQILDRTFAWEDPSAHNVGFRMVIRLHGREEDGR